MNAEALLAQYERIAEAPDAIARLRRFVLDLAVRGKLVPQDVGDEPAPELLARIAHERARLAKARAISPPTEPRSTEDGTLLLEIPSHWAEASVRDLLHELQTGPFGSSLHEHDYREGGTPVINPASLQGGTIVPISKMAVGADTLERLSTFRLRAGDIVMGRRGEMGRCALVTEREAGWLCGTGSLILRPSPLVFGPFLVLLIGSPFGREYLGGAAVGTTMQNLNQAILLKMRFGLPPQAEQRRIVAKVHELMALCDRLEAARTAREATRDRLAAASLARLNTPDPETFPSDARFALDALPALTTRPNQIKHLRQTILNLAVRGKLVPQDPDDGSAADLLSRLRKAQSVALVREGIRSRPPVARVGRDDLWFTIPESWECPAFDDLFVIVSGVTLGQRVAASEAINVPYLRVANVQRGFLDLTIIKTLSVRATDRDRYTLRYGDLLMTEGGDWDKLGRTAVWRDELPGCIHQNHVFRVRPPSEEISPEWVAMYANSLLGRQYFGNAAKQTTNLASINMTQLRGCPLPLPPLAEQHRIVAKVNELMALCDALEESLAAATTARTRLLDATLAEALAPSTAHELEAAE